MADWKRVKLGDVCSKITSGGTPSTKHPEYYGGSIPWLRTQEVDFKPIFDTEIKITEAGLKNSSAKWIPKNSVIIAMYGATAGRVALTKIDLTTNQACCNLIVDESKADYRYIYHLMRRHSQVLESMANGSAQTNLSASIIKKFEIPLSPLATQRRIAEVLSAYDDKIDNNRRRMELLEESARLIYRKMFGKGAKRGGTTGTDGTTGTTGTVGTIGELCETIGGGTPKTSVEEYWNGDIPWVVPTDITRNSSLVLIDTERKITKLGLEKSSARMLPSGAILMTSRASVGYFGIADFPVCTNQGFISIVPNNKNHYWFLLFNLMSRVEEIRGLAKGATFPEISKTSFRSIEITIPPDDTLESFNANCEEIFGQLQALAKQNRALAAARDMLLPRLMSGKMEVGE